MTIGYARARFTSALLAAVIGAIVGIAALGLSPVAARWVAFGGGSVAFVVVALAFLAPRRGAAQRVLDLPAALIGVWLIVAARTIETSGSAGTPHVIKWLNFAAGAALCGIGIVGLLLHEVGLEHDLTRLADESWAVRAVRGHDNGTVQEPVTVADRYADALSRTAGQ